MPLYVPHRPGYHPGESSWKHHKFHKLSAAISPWLLDQGSLTRRLLAVSKGNFEVQVLSQQWQCPRYSEAAMLGIKPRQQAIVREVLLLCYNQPWVFARSIIPASSINGRLRRLRKFDNSSLGAMLFKEPSMRRQPFQLAIIDGDSEQLPPTLHQSNAMWGRRCQFKLANKSIMVSEIFLTAFKP